MTDLRVDYALLEDSSASLSAIHDCLDGLRARAADAHTVWGSHDIADAMGSFAGDWDHHRHQAMSSVQSVRETVEKTLESFRKADGDIAASLEQQRHTTTYGGTGGPR